MEELDPLVVQQVLQQEMYIGQNKWEKVTVFLKLFKQALLPLKEWRNIHVSHTIVSETHYIHNKLKPPNIQSNII